MRIQALMYHDVVHEPEWDASGFTGKAAAIYKLDHRQFRLHLNRIRCNAGGDCIRLCTDTRSGIQPAVYLTFDDGGVSAQTIIADMLEEHGWPAHFFVTTGRIGQPGFLSPFQIRDLRRRGHLIGTHSVTHPARMSACSAHELDDEWRSSILRLSDILSEEVTTGSVPGGYYSRPIAEAAAQNGLRFLFNSEPTARVTIVNGCVVFGRYTIWRGMPPSVSGALASGQFVACWKQSAVWNAKKLLKTVAGKSYLKLRDSMLSRSA
jgi:peptidoglycan/xylan/chitin deacetylase (PgdA/CDA1 family)